MAAKAKEHKAVLSANPELWTANMPEKFLTGYVQTQVNDIRRQLAQIEDRDSDSDSSDSDSDDEWSVNHDELGPWNLIR